MSQSRNSSQGSLHLPIRARPSMCSNISLNDVQITLPEQQRLPSLAASEGAFNIDQSWTRGSNGQIYQPRQSFSNELHREPMSQFTDLMQFNNRSSIQISPVQQYYQQQQQAHQQPQIQQIQPEIIFRQDQFTHQLPYQTMDMHSQYTCLPSSIMSMSPAMRCNPGEICYPEWSHHYPNSTYQVSGPPSISEMSEEDEAIYDKPYAQLIYEALLKAPGHRMLLRDIYEWFIQNTNKPRESGTNGWQNSIRHNLSMNKVSPSLLISITTNVEQAFENDKSDPASARGARKANSVWILTAEALKNGVQSTTRYRKSGPGKKGVVNKGPAVQRQRSGAKGGKAAKRAAQIKRHMETPPRTFPRTFSASPTISSPQDEWSNVSASPATPTDRFSACYNIPTLRYGYEDFTAKYEADGNLEDYHLRQMLSQSVPEETYDELSYIPRNDSN